MNKELKRKIESFEGTVLGVGLEEEWKREIEKNLHILTADFLDQEVAFSKGKKEKKKGKKVDIRDLKKHFKRKVDYLLVHQETILKYEKTFIPDSLRITKKQIIIYGENKELLKKYEQFQKVTLLKVEKQTFLAQLDMENYTPSKAKEWRYYLKEIFYCFIDEMADFLSNK